MGDPVGSIQYCWHTSIGYDFYGNASPPQDKISSTEGGESCTSLCTVNRIAQQGLRKGGPQGDGKLGVFVFSTFKFEQRSWDSCDFA